MENMGNNAQNGGNEKTFTQEEVNQIVQDRLARERNKQHTGPGTEDREKDLEKREKNLAARERVLEVGKILKDNELPDCFAEILTESQDMKAVAALLRRGLDENMKAHRPTIKGVTPAYEPRRGDTKGCSSEDLRRAFGFYD